MENEKGSGRGQDESSEYGYRSSIQIEKIEKAEQHIDRLANAFESSAKRWELIIYPSLFAFILLAGFGFFLIYSLTYDIAHMARNISSMTTTIEKMVNSVDGMRVDVHDMAIEMGEISTQMGEMKQQMNHMTPIQSSIDDIAKDTSSMAKSTEGMRLEMGAMNYNIRPIRRISNIVPW